ncbi:MAG TPA: hypothetical protein PLS10_04535 [Chitinophagales bacterium]|nr:hypothetical protein [Chitinophagales bacterium]
MSRLKKNQNIDGLIHSITAITQSQCSLSEPDLKVLNEALESIQLLKQRKGKTNEQILLEVVKVIRLLTRFFVENEKDEIKDVE